MMLCYAAYDDLPPTHSVAPLESIMPVYAMQEVMPRGDRHEPRSVKVLICSA